MDVHPAPVLSVDGFRHEGGVEPVHPGHFFRHVAENHGRVGDLEGVGIFEIDFVLAVGDFMMVVFGFDTHHVEKELDFLAEFAVAAAEKSNRPRRSRKYPGRWGRRRTRVRGRT